MILVTVGSMFPFDRLIRAVDEIAGRTGPQAFFAQIGDGRYEPVHMPFVRFLPREEFARLLAEAEMVLSHAGVGTIVDTLKFRKPLLVLPRRERLGEHVNDHQQGTARRFEALNHVLVASRRRRSKDSWRVCAPSCRQPAWHARKSSRSGSAPPSAYDHSTLRCR